MGFTRPQKGGGGGGTTDTTHLQNQITDNAQGISLLYETVNNLTSSKGEISSSTSQVINTTEDLLTFEVSQPSIDTSIFDFDDSQNYITFKKAGSYNFFSTLEISSSTSGSKTIDFNLVNVADNTIIKNHQIVSTISAGTTKSFKINTPLLLIGSQVPLTIKIVKVADSVGGTIEEFESVLTSDNTSNGGEMLKSVYDTGDNGKVDKAENSDTVNNLTVETAVPVGALFTDTVYDDTDIQEEVDLNTGSRHSHSNKSILDNITASFTDEEKTKLSNLEENATSDQTATEIKTLYESNSDTNVFTDSEKTKLSNLEEGSTGDQTAEEIKTLYESNSDTNAFTDNEKTKLSNQSGTNTGDQDLSIYEILANKKTDIEANKTSDEVFASIKSIYDWVYNFFIDKDNIKTINSHTLIGTGDLIIKEPNISVSSVSSDYTATTNDQTLIVDTASGNVSITLPSTSGNSGKIFHIKKIKSENNVIVTPEGTSTIDDDATKTIALQYTCMSIQCNNDNWFII